VNFAKLISTDNIGDTAITDMDTGTDMGTDTDRVIDTDMDKGTDMNMDNLKGCYATTKSIEIVKILKEKKVVTYFLALEFILKGIVFLDF
jgi:hypothetical protein